MTMVTGTVTGKSDKFGKYSLVLDNGQWYGTKMEWAPKFEINVGDVITFDSGPTGKYLQKVKKTGGGAPTGATSPPAAPQKAVQGRTFPVGALAPERTINRQNALTNAVAYVSNSSMEEATPEEVIEVAKMFEAYTTGDLDAVEAKEAMAMLEGGS